MAELTITAALKKKKSLFEKATDLRHRIGRLSAHMDNEKNPEGFSDPKGQVALWLQQHKDIINEIEDLTVHIQRTNILTNVTIIIGDKTITKSITGWVVRRQKLAEQEQAAWTMLSGKNLKPQVLNKDKEGKSEVVQVVYNYDARERDDKISLYRSEPSLIDSALETVNATTTLITNNYYGASAI
jgi:hypothetical protein